MGGKRWSQQRPRRQEPPLRSLKKPCSQYPHLPEPDAERQTPRGSFHWAPTAPQPRPPRRHPTQTRPAPACASAPFPSLWRAFSTSNLVPRFPQSRLVSSWRPCPSALRTSGAAWSVTNQARALAAGLLLPGPRTPAQTGSTANAAGSGLSHLLAPGPAHPLRGTHHHTSLPTPGLPWAGRGLRVGGPVTFITAPSPVQVPKAPGLSHSRHSHVLSEQTSDSNLILNLFHVFYHKKTHFHHLIQQLEIKILDESDTRQCFSSIQKLNSFNL